MNKTKQNRTNKTKWNKGIGKNGKKDKAARAVSSFFRTFRYEALVNYRVSIPRRLTITGDLILCILARSKI
jgi:hypothetical protein